MPIKLKTKFEIGETVKLNHCRTTWKLLTSCGVDIGGYDVDVLNIPQNVKIKDIVNPLGFRWPHCVKNRSLGYSVTDCGIYLPEELLRKI